MQSWSDGYITDLPYTRNFFTDLSPVNLRLTCALAGVVPPPLASGFDYCELGCGQGLTTALLAAMFPQGRFLGVDINPTHIGLARKFAEENGIANVSFLDASFEEATARDDLPGFDYIVLHGIYSWISRSQRDHIVRFIYRHLKAGGVVYNSYNAKPGKLNLEPVRQVFTEILAPATNPIQQVAAGFAMLDELAARPMGVFQQMRGFKETVQGLKRQSRQYLAHEFLNEHWNSFYCTEVFREMAEAKLTYVGSTQPGLNFEGLSVPRPFLEKFRSLETLPQRQLFRDLLLNTAFRKDVYVRGPMTIPAAERNSVNASVFLGRAPFHHAFRSGYRCGAGDVDMTNNRDVPLVYERLRRNVMTMAELSEGLDDITPPRVMEAVRHLLTSHQICPYAAGAPEDADIGRINRRAIANAVRDGQGTWLCSDKLGNAVVLPFLHALMLHVHQAGENRDNAPAAVAHILAERGAGITVNNREIKEREDIVRHVRDMYAHFENILQELGRLGVFGPGA